MSLHIVWDLDPKIFNQIEFLRWYGLCWVVGIFIGYQLLLSIYKAEGIPDVEVDRLATYVMLGAIIGARLGHVLFYDPQYYWQHPIEILPISIEPTFTFTGLAGLASHGGIFGALLALFLYQRKFTKSYWWLLDRLTISGTLLGGFIRLGNLMNSEIVGLPTNLPWAFVFIRIDQTPRHPTQLYEALFYLLLGVALYLIWRKGKFANNKGFIFGLGITLIFFQRFLVEYVKENQVGFEEGLILNMGQILSIPLFLIGLVVVVWSLKSKKPM